MKRVLGCLAIAGLWGSGVAHADETATLVITDDHQARLDRELPAGVPVKIQVPVRDADPTRGTLTVYPLLGAGCHDPGRDGTQRREYGMSISGGADARVLEATISPLQIATVYCLDVAYERGLSSDKLAQLADLVAATPIAWPDTCTQMVPDSARPGRLRRVAQPPATQIATVRAAIEARLTDALGKLREPVSGASARIAVVTRDPTQRIAAAAAALTELLDVPGRCFALGARLADEDRAAEDHRLAVDRQRQAAAAVKQLPIDIQAWPAVVVTTGGAPVAMRLFDALGLTAALAPMVAHVDLADPAFAIDLAGMLDAPAADAPGRRNALRNRLAAPPAQRLPIVIYLPTAGRSERAEDLFQSPSFDQDFVPELVKLREPIIRQIELLERQDRLTAARWTAALLQLADDGAAALEAMRRFTDAERARGDAEAAIAPALKLLVQGETVRNLLRRTEVIRDTPEVAQRETDDKASWIAPTAGVMVAAPLLLAERRFADPWLVPYLGASLYFARVDRVIDVDHLVGPQQRLFWQRNSFSVGLVLSRPSLRGKTVAGPWAVDVLPFLGFGHRFTQYLRGDLGAIVFQYSDRVPVVAELHWGVASWLGVSIDADVWAVFSGKLGR